MPGLLNPQSRQQLPLQALDAEHRVAPLVPAHLHGHIQQLSSQQGQQDVLLLGGGDAGRGPLGSLSSGELTSGSQAGSDVSCRHGHWPGNTFLAVGLGSSS